MEDREKLLISLKTCKLHFYYLTYHAHPVLFVTERELLLIFSGSLLYPISGVEYLRYAFVTADKAAY